MGESGIGQQTPCCPPSLIFILSGSFSLGTSTLSSTTFNSNKDLSTLSYAYFHQHPKRSIRVLKEL